MNKTFLHQKKRLQQLPPKLTPKRSHQLPNPSTSQTYNAKKDISFRGADLFSLQGTSGYPKNSRGRKTWRKKKLLFLLPTDTTRKRTNISECGGCRDSRDLWSCLSHPFQSWLPWLLCKVESALCPQTRFLTTTFSLFLPLPAEYYPKWGCWHWIATLLTVIPWLLERGVTAVCNRWTFSVIIV